VVLSLSVTSVFGFDTCTHHSISHLQLTNVLSYPPPISQQPKQQKYQRPSSKPWRNMDSQEFRRLILSKRGNKCGKRLPPKIQKRRLHCKSIPSCDVGWVSRGGRGSRVRIRFGTELLVNSWIGGVTLPLRPLDQDTDFWNPVYSNPYHVCHILLSRCVLCFLVQSSSSRTGPTQRFVNWLSVEK
jgi:hypothetical protein